MGQSHTHLRDNRDRQDSISQSGFDKPYEYIETQENCCCYSIKNAPPKELTWKDYMIKQLNQSECDKWPSILIKNLRGHSDNVNRISIRRKLPGNKQNAPQKPPTDFLKPIKNHSEAISVNNNDEDSFIVNNRSYEKYRNLAIKEILDDSVILEENFVPTNYLEIYEPKTTGDDNMRPTTPFASGYSQDFFRSNYMARSHSSSYSNNKNNFESYKNNTILNQFNAGIRIQTMNSSQNIEQKEIQACVLYFKQVTGKIEVDFREKNNIFKQLLSLFEDYFVKQYKNTIYQKDHGVSVQILRIIQKALKDIREFIHILSNGINMFYRLQSLKKGKLNNGYCVFNYDNISNFITTLVLKNKLYDMVFQLASIEGQSTEKLYRSKLELFNKLAPQDFGVPDEYCLNEKSVQSLRDKGAFLDNRPTSNSPLSEAGILERQNAPEHKSIEFYLKSHEVDVSPIKDTREDTNTTNYEPYEKAIIMLKGLRYQKSPIHKLKVILKTVEVITRSIDEFYQKFGTKNRQNLAGEHVFAIFCFIVVKSGVMNILTHCRIIYELSTPNVKSSMSGYYATTLEACMKHICQMSFSNSKDIKS